MTGHLMLFVLVFALVFTLVCLVVLCADKGDKRVWSKYDWHEGLAGFQETDTIKHFIDGLCLRDVQ